MEARSMRLLQESGGRTIADKSFVASLSQKWAPLLEGVKDPYTRGVMAVLFENEMDHLKNLHEETLSTGVGSFTKYIFPILRRVFPNLIANQIVSVQPMTAPVGGIFTYEYKYGNNKGSITAGQNLVETFNEWFSSEYIDSEVLVTLGSAANTASGTLDWLPIRPKDTSRPDSGVVISLTLTGGGAATVIDNGAGALSTTVDANFGGTVNYTTGAVSLNARAGGGTETIAAGAITAAYYYNSENVGSTSGAQIPSINVDISLETVTAKTRKLKARWSSEAADDLKAFHGIDAEGELVAGIANQIALEMDREVIDDLVNGAAHTATFTHAPTGWHVSGGASELESVRHLLTMIDSVSAVIHKESMRAPGNFIVTSPAVAALLSQLTTHGDFQPGTSPDMPPNYGPLTSNFGITRLGTLMNRYVVYQDPFLASNKLLVGLKGSNFLDAGYVHAPYIPLQVTPSFLDPDDFVFRKAMRTRYANKLLRPEFYGTVTVNGLPTVTT